MNVELKFIDGTSRTFNDNSVTNLSELVDWLSSINEFPFRVSTTNKITIILYKHAIISAEVH